MVKIEQAGLVDTNRGQISREIFVNGDLYEREKERVFGSAWLYVGHESQIPSPGDFVLSRMGEESVILTRDTHGSIRVLLNSCRHRGMRVCRYDEGTTKKFYCPYHGWSYNLDGSLARVTEHDTEYQTKPMAWSDWGLISVAKLAVLQGTIWATWDAGAPDFDTYLGGAKKVLNLGLSAWDGVGEVEVLGTTQKWVIPSNWKICSENFAGDGLHNVSHRSVDMIGIGPNGQSGRRDDWSKEAYRAQISFDEGHAGVALIYDEEAARLEYQGSEITAAYFQECLAKRRKNLGEDARIMAGVGTIFPNMSYHGNQPRTILVAHPNSVGETEMWRQYLVDKEAPKEVKSFLRSYYIRYSGPAGMTEQDDMENWNFATTASNGFIARKYPYNYMAGLGAECPNPMIPHSISSSTPHAESNARSFYKRWSRYMTNETEEGAL